MAYGDDYEPLPGVTSGAPRYQEPVPWLPPPVPEAPIWPTSNPVGTQGFVDYRGWDQPYYPPQPQQDPVQGWIAPAPNTEYGTVLPYARDTQTGELRWAMPSIARDYVQGQYDLSQGPRTGTVTPEATSVLGGSALRTSMQGNVPGSVALRSFGGERSNTADLQLLKQARRETYRDQPATPEQIWQNTGWWLHPSGRWKNEMSDDKMAYNAHPALVGPGGLHFMNNRPVDTTYGQMVHAPEIQQAYPMLNKMPVLFGQLPPGAQAAYGAPKGKGDPGRLLFGDELPFFSDMAHETQHAIQRQEGFTPGGSPNLDWVSKHPVLAPHFRDVVSDQVRKLTTPRSYDEYFRVFGPPPAGKDPMAVYQRYLKQVQNTPIVPGSQLHQDILNYAAQDVYDRIGGEVEARLVQKRLSMTPQERIDRPPWLDWDTPADQQIFTRPWAKP